MEVAAVAEGEVAFFERLLAIPIVVVDFGIGRAELVAGGFEIAVAPVAAHAVGDVEVGFAILIEVDEAAPGPMVLSRPMR